VRVPPGQVKNELSIRVSLIKKAFQHLDVHATLLDDAAALQAYASCLALGTHLPSFEVEVFMQQEERAISTVVPTTAASSTKSVPEVFQREMARSLWKKRIKGLHHTFVYQSANPQKRIEQEAVRLADLVAPSTVTLDLTRFLEGMNVRDGRLGRRSSCLSFLYESQPSKYGEMSRKFICSCARIHYWWKLPVSQQTFFCGDTAIDMYRRMFAFYNKFLFLNPPKSGQVHAKMWGRKRCENLTRG
jgi:hypothetical protein